MDLDTAQMLSSADGAQAVAAALSESDPESLAAATRLRTAYPAPLAAAALTQAALRRRAEFKLGSRAGAFLVTADGLEQASRWDVAAWRARHVAASGARRVIDLCCGLGVDAAAFAEEGLEVLAIERDPATAVLARANLHGLATVVAGDAVDVVPDAAVEPGTVVFCDPARRTARGRSWDIGDMSPSWAFVEGLLAGTTPAVVKLGPGFPDRLIPAAVAARWVSVDGDLVECGLWSGMSVRSGDREAILLPAGDRLPVDTDPPPAASRGPRVGDIVYEPDPAVIRSGAIGTLCRFLDAEPIAQRISYLLSQTARPTAFARAFEVLRVDPWKQRLLAEWAAAHDVGVLEIKKRGVDLDPARVRRQLRLRGSRSATVIVTPSAIGTVCLVVRRVDDRTPDAWHSA